MFENFVSRRNTNCAKWDENIEETGVEELIPLTVADMDYRCAPEIVSAVIEAANHGIYGYTIVSDKYTELTKEWIEKHYNWKLEKDWIVYCPRIIQAICLMIQNYTDKNDKVLVLNPLYDPIKSVIKENDRELVTSSLVFDNNYYTIDFKDFENKIKSGVKIFIPVSPHNPVGRVWKDGEIKQMIDICKENDVLIISDEVHADFIWKGKFVSFGQFYNDYDKMIICTSASKTFNIPGLEASSIIIYNEKIRNDFKKMLRQAGIHNPSYFCIPAVEAAYEYGEEWLNLAKKEIAENIDIVKDFFKNEVKNFKVTDSEGTFMMWVDYRDTGIKEPEMKDIMLNKAKMLFSLGGGYGSEGEGFFRINVALPKKLLKEALTRFKNNIN